VVAALFIERHLCQFEYIWTLFYYLNGSAWCTAVRVVVLMYFTVAQRDVYTDLSSPHLKCTSSLYTSSIPIASWAHILSCTILLYCIMYRAVESLHHPTPRLLHGPTLASIILSECTELLQPSPSQRVCFVYMEVKASFVMTQRHRRCVDLCIVTRFAPC
jgi:hypothetical protein